eukprot:scpid68764/ scgid25108/ 
MAQWFLVITVPILVGMQVASGKPAGFIEEPALRAKNDVNDGYHEKPASHPTTSKEPVVIKTSLPVNVSTRHQPAKLIHSLSCKSGEQYRGDVATGLRCGPCQCGHNKLQVLEVKVSTRCCKDIPDKSKKMPVCISNARNRVKCSCQCREGRLQPYRIPHHRYDPTSLKSCLALKRRAKAEGREWP